MATGSWTDNLLALLLSAGAALATFTGPAAAQDTGLYADFDLDYIYTLPPGATEFNASEQLTYPQWWIELENVSDSVIPIDGVVFDAPYPFSYTWPDWDEANGYTYTFPGEYMLPGDTYTIRAEQESEGEQIRIPLTVSRQIAGSEITGEGDVTITFSATPEEGLNGLEFMLAVIPSETREDWEHETYFGTVTHVSAYPYDDSLDHIDTEHGQIYVWSYPDYTPGQEYTFQCTVTVTLDDPYDHVFIEPVAQAAAHRVDDYGTEVWTDNVLDVPAPHTGTVEVDSSTAISDDNSSHYIPWVGVEMPHDVKLYSGIDIFHVPAEYGTIQAAIDAAVGPTLILVEPGTYEEMINFSGKQVVIRSVGGAEVTIIDAQENGRVVTATNGEGPDVVLEGFTITGGMPPGDDWYGGGGAYLYNSSPAFIDCVFSGNHAPEDDYSGSRSGGAIYVRYAEYNPPTCNEHYLTITNCVFDGNTATYSGGAIYTTAYSDFASVTATISLHQCTFIGNQADRFGGALRFSGGEGADMSMNVIDCSFSSNTAGIDGGAIYTYLDSWASADLSLEASAFTNNNCAESGGALFLGETPVNIAGCTFTSNHSETGGAIRVGKWGYGIVTMTDCVLTENTATGIGGAVDVGGGDLTATNCEFAGNSAVWGGGLFAGDDDYATTLALTGCTVDGNDAVYGGGAFISSWGDVESFTDCTFSQNTAYQGAGLQVYEGVAVLEACSFELNTATIGGGISNVMGYLGVGNSYFCENAPEHIDGYWEDYGGNEFEERCIVDCPEDVNGDENVDIDDLFAILAHWGEGPGTYDVNGDGVVDIDDVFAVLAAWGPCP